MTNVVVFKNRDFYIVASTWARIGAQLSQQISEDIDRSQKAGKIN